MDISKFLAQRYGFVGTDGTPGLEPILREKSLPNRIIQIDQKPVENDEQSFLESPISDADLFRSLHGTLDYGDLNEQRELREVEREMKVSRVSQSLSQIDLLVNWLKERTDLNKEMLFKFMAKRLEAISSSYPVGDKLQIFRDWGTYGLKNLDKFFQLDKRADDGSSQFKIQLFRHEDHDLLKVAIPELDRTESIKLAKNLQ